MVGAAVLVPVLYGLSFEWSGNLAVLNGVLEGTVCGRGAGTSAVQLGGLRRW